jgi:hypothetical protein
MKHTFAMHLYQRQYDFDDEPSWVLSDHDFLAAESRMYVKPVTVTVEVPDAFIDMREHKVKELRAEEENVRAEFTKKLTEIQARIQSLLALEMA